ncbi:hypothetical protein F4680DRAFT_442946 [Xylaria scruposa]|nr:hypothetical protein F4680DRAFT_442946 [Xylaria scruposa]
MPSPTPSADRHGSLELAGLEDAAAAAPAALNPKASDHKASDVQMSDHDGARYLDIDLPDPESDVHLSPAPLPSGFIVPDDVPRSFVKDPDARSLPASLSAGLWAPRGYPRGLVVVQEPVPINSDAHKTTRAAEIIESSNEDSIPATPRRSGRLSHTAPHTPRVQVTITDIAIFN